VSLIALKLIALLLILLGLFSAGAGLYWRGGSSVLLAWLRYARFLDSLLKPLGVKLKGSRMAALQLAGVFAALLIGIGFKLALGFALAAVAAPVVLPIVSLQSKTRSRSQQIDQAMPDFMLAFANSLRVTPSIGRALQQLSELQTGPMADELKLAVQELRIGTGVEQAMYNMAARMKSVYADSAFAGVLIGRQVGGNIPEILESTAETIRELERLHGVLRTKTAEAKGQLYVMAIAPAVVGVAYELLKPGHFDPFFETRSGTIMLVSALALWIGGVLIAARMLKVDF